MQCLLSFVRYLLIFLILDPREWSHRVWDSLVHHDIDLIAIILLDIAKLIIIVAFLFLLYNICFYTPSIKFYVQVRIWPEWMISILKLWRFNSVCDIIIFLLGYIFFYWKLSVILHFFVNSYFFKAICDNHRFVCCLKRSVIYSTNKTCRRDPSYFC